MWHPWVMKRMPAVAGAAAACLLAGWGPAPAAEPPLACRFTEACHDQRPCFDSAYAVSVSDAGGGLVRLDYSDGRARLARIERGGYWTSYQTDEDLGRQEVLDVGPDGEAVLVATQPAAPPYVSSRTGRCEAATQEDPPG